MRSLSIAAVALLGTALSVANAQQVKSSHSAPLQHPSKNHVVPMWGTTNPNPAPLKGLSGPSNHSFVSGGSDTCGTATAISGAGPFNGDNLGATLDGPANCGAMGADVWYDWTAGASGPMIFSLCGSNYDTVISVYDTNACTGTLLGCDDDSACGLQSSVTVPVTSGNVYKVQVGGFAGSTGNYTLNISAAPTCPCSGAPPEGEAGCGIPVDTFNGGCNSSPFVYSTIACGGSVCGTGAFNGSLRDTDWYQFTLAIPQTVTLNVTAEFPVVAYIIDNNCPATILSANNGPACTPISTTYTLGAGTWVAFVAPDFSQLITCGTNDTYHADLQCANPPPPPPNDDCSTPTVVSGAGPFNFDNTNAITGSQGQSEALCIFYGTPSVTNDIWYTWTASATGQASVSTCGQTGVDTKIAVYPGAGCPAAAAIGCNDDSCGSFESTTCFPCTNGQTYTIQLGTYPGALGGTGTFTITTTTGGSACQKDDGSSENMLGWYNGGDMVWLQSFGSNGGGSTTVSNIQVAYGSAAFPGLSPGNGSPVRVAIWDDPNDDGDPSDAVLLQVVNTTVANVDTDQLNTVAITPVSVNGVFFVGASEVHTGAGGSGIQQYVAVMDQSSCITPGGSWFFGNDNSTPADLTNPTNNVQLPLTFDAIGFSCNLLLRAGCNVSPVSAFCLPGQSGVHACPCANPPAGTGLGCNNFGAGPVDSATLTGAGSSTIASDTLVFTSSGENNTSFTIFAQGTTQLPAGVVFGAGVRCVAGVLKRLYTGNAAGGTIVRPGGADPSVHVRSAALGYTIVPPITLYYFAYYRDPAASGPCGSATATFNSTQAGSVLWQ